MNEFKHKRSSGTEAHVCNDIADRQALGLNKYGVTVCNNPLALKAWLQHAYEECLDQAVYLKRAIHKLEENQDDLEVIEMIKDNHEEALEEIAESNCKSVEQLKMIAIKALET